MKSIRVDFVPRKAWQGIWATAGICVLCVAGAAGWRWMELHTAAQALADQLQSVQQEIQRLRQPVTNAADPRYASAEQAARLLQLDLNKAFAVVENIREPGVRLRNMQLEPGSNTLRLEYELDAMAKTTLITELLNAGYDVPPWQLESVTSMPPSQAGFMAISQIARGIWSAQLSRL